MSDQVVYVDPATLLLPESRMEGAAQAKLDAHKRRFGDDVDSIPPIELWRYADGGLVVVSGVTRATRMAKIAPGRLIPAVIIQNIRAKTPRILPTVGDRLP